MSLFVLEFFQSTRISIICQVPKQESAKYTNMGRKIQSIICIQKKRWIFKAPSIENLFFLDY